MDLNHFNNSGRVPPKDHLSEFFFQNWTRGLGGGHLSQLLRDKDDHKSSPCQYVTGELKNNKRGAAINSPSVETSGHHG